VSTDEDYLSEKMPDSPLGLTIGQRAQSQLEEWIAGGKLVPIPSLEVPPSRRTLRNAQRRVIG